jgi:hypothetical protein
MTTVKSPPETVEEAVDYLEAHLSLAESYTLSAINKEYLGDLYYSVGAYAKDILDLCSGNEALLESCRNISGDKTLDADEASMLIISLLWDVLHKDDDRKSEPVSDKLDEKELVTQEELLMSEVIQSMALINLLDRKGIISKKELLEEIIQVKRSTLKADR